MTPTLLVTGGAGFIGSHVVDAAVGAGWSVRVLDTAREDVDPRGRGEVDVLRGDVTDPVAAAAAVRGVDAVCHLAAKVGLGVDFSDAPDYSHTNVTGTAVLLSAMADAGVRRLVLSSSMVVYGAGTSRDALGALATPGRDRADLEAGRYEPVSPRTGVAVEPDLVEEDAPSDPQNVYAASKLAQELLSRAWARETGGAVAMLRYHNVYGPRMPRDTPYAGVAAIFRSALENGQPPRLFEDGGQRRDFVHVRDVALANLAAAAWTDSEQPGSARAFNIASGEVHTVGELAAALSATLGGPAPIVVGGFRMGDVRHITASAERASRELGWRARIGFDEGMAEFARAPLGAAAG